MCTISFLKIFLKKKPSFQIFCRSIHKSRKERKSMNKILKIKLKMNPLCKDKGSNTFYEQVQRWKTSAGRRRRRSTKMEEQEPCLAWAGLAVPITPCCCWLMLAALSPALSSHDPWHPVSTYHASPTTPGCSMHSHTLSHKHREWETMRVVQDGVNKAWQCDADSWTMYLFTYTTGKPFRPE